MTRQTSIHNLSKLCLSMLLMTGAWPWAAGDEPAPNDHIRELQTMAIGRNQADFGHWGYKPEEYTQWGSHSNRLIPIYTFGTHPLQTQAGKQPALTELAAYTGKNSPYRSADALRKIYGFLPEATVNPQASYCDQTNLYDLQKAAAQAGKKYIFLVVFDGMDWQSTWNASIDRNQKVAYKEGRGSGFHFQDYTAGGTTEFGYMVTSPHNEGTQVDVDLQTVKNPGGKMLGGYDVTRGGEFPWSIPADPKYLVASASDKRVKHAYTDSSSSASSMTAGKKTYNNAVNVYPDGSQFETIAHQQQRLGWSVGVVTSVPVPHATPACAYAHNIDRDDYQDLTRDLVGLPSIAHPQAPLPGMDVVIGGGAGTDAKEASAQGKNFVPGNLYLTDADKQTIDVTHGGKYRIAERLSGTNGASHLMEMARLAAEKNERLFGFYGVGAYKGHLPFATANGDFKPAPGRSGSAEKYTRADLSENPTLAQMTEAALVVLEAKKKPFWLMVEAGDVDWANHDNNLDNSIGAIESGDNAVRVITDWVEKHSNWEESLVIVTADHGHYFHLLQPEALIAPNKVAKP